MNELLPNKAAFKKFFKTQLRQWYRKGQAYFKTSCYPSFHELLPYRLIDQTTELLIQEGSVGYGFEWIPLAGVDASMIEKWHDLFRLKLTDDTIVQVILMASNQVSPQLKKAETHHHNPLTALQLKWKEVCTQNGFSNRLNLKLGLKDYRVFCFISQKGNYTTRMKTALIEQRDRLESELKANQIHFKRLGSNDLIALVQVLCQLSPDRIHPSEVRYHPHVSLHEQMIDESFELHESTESMTASTLCDQGNSRLETVIQALKIRRYPESLSLMQGADGYAPILERAKTIGCPFVISWCYRLKNQEKMKQMAARRYRKSTANLKRGLSEFLSNLNQSRKEWDMIRERLDQDQVSLVHLHYTVLLYSRPKEALQNLEAARACFRSQDIDVLPVRHLQKNAYLATFPFLPSCGFLDDFALLRMAKTMTSFNAVNFLPIIADSPLSDQGILLPSFREQVAFFNPFDERLPITNFNMAIAGTTGAGKSFFVNALLFDLFNQGAHVFVIDKGDSYQKLCHLLNGAYLQAETLHLNPFTHVSDIKPEAESIRDLLAVMASPDTALDEVSQEFLREAIVSAFEKDQQQTTIDSVVETLRDKFQRKPDARLDDLMTLLYRYTTAGTYPETFNRSSPMAPSQRFIVLELGGLSNSPQLMKAVLFALMLVIKQRLAKLPRDVKKVIVLDEAAKMLSEHHSSEARFFNNQARETRKYRASLMMISQCLDDFIASDAGRAIFANASIKAVLLQKTEGMSQFLDWQDRQGGAPYFDQYTMTVLKSFGQAYRQGFSDILLKMGEGIFFHRLFADPFSKILFSSHAKEFEAVRALQAKGMSLSNAVIEVAKSTYPEEMKRLETDV